MFSEWKLLCWTFCYYKVDFVFWRVFRLNCYSLELKSITCFYSALSFEEDRLFLNFTKELFDWQSKFLSLFENILAFKLNQSSSFLKLFFKFHIFSCLQTQIHVTKLQNLFSLTISAQSWTYVTILCLGFHFSQCPKVVIIIFIPSKIEHFTSRHLELIFSNKKTYWNAESPSSVSVTFFIYFLLV